VAVEEVAVAEVEAAAVVTRAAAAARRARWIYMR